MKLSKNGLYLAIIMLCFALTSCSKDDNDDIIDVTQDEAGKIPGLGEAAGELSGEPFVLPSGLSLTKDIKGYDGYYSRTYAASNNANQPNNLKKMSKALRMSSLRERTLALRADGLPDHTVGSGVFVTLAVEIKNETDATKNLLFPAGLIVKSRSGDYQNGVLLKKTEVSIPGNTTQLVVLLMYCGNAKKSPSSTAEFYDFAVVSNSSTIHDLIDRLKNKKINYEDFSDDTSSVFTDQVFRIQDILWQLTDFPDGLSEDDISYINELPGM